MGPPPILIYLWLFSDQSASSPAVAAADRRVAVRDLPHGLDLARDVYAVARTASVRRPSVAVIVTALRAAGPSRPRALSPGLLGPVP